MDRHQLDLAVPIAYAAVLIVCALWIHAALTPVAIVGALAIGFYYAVLRQKGEDGCHKSTDLKKR